MKFFILTLIGLVALFFLSSCGLIQTHSYNKEQIKFNKEYGGLYVFDKALNDEMIQIEGEWKRKYDEFMDDWFKTHEFFTKDDLPLLEKILPPKVLSNGCRYFIKGMSKKESKETDLSPYLEKIKEYMGEEAFEVLKGRFDVTSYYIDKNNKVIPITMFPYIATSTTTYGIYGDEGGGIRFSDTTSGNVTKSNLFYLIDGKFVKSDKRRQGWWK